MQVNNQISSDFQFFGKKNSVASGANGFLELFEQVLAGSMENSNSVHSFSLIEALNPDMEQINLDENYEESAEELEGNQVEFNFGAVKTSHGSGPEVPTTSVPFEIPSIKNVPGGFSVPLREEATEGHGSEENSKNPWQVFVSAEKRTADVEEGAVIVERKLTNSVDFGSTVIPKDVDSKGLESKSKTNLSSEAIRQGSYEAKSVVQDVQTEADKSTKGVGNSEVGALKQESVIEPKNPKTNSSTNNAIGQVEDLVQKPETSSRGFSWNNLASNLTVNEFLKKEKKIVKDTEAKIDSKAITQKDEVVITKPSILPTGYQNLSSEFDKAKAMGSQLGGPKVAVEVSESQDFVSTGARSEIEEMPRSATLKSYDQNLFQKNLSTVLFNAKETPTPNIYQNQVHSQLIKSFSLMQQNSVNEVLINLKPEFLGNVSINLTIQNGEVMGKIAVAKKEVKDLIEGQLSSLKSSLAQVNIKVDQITVVQDASLKDSGQQNQAQNFSGGNSNGAKGNSGQQKYQASAGLREHEEVGPTPTGTTLSQGVNYLV